MKKLIKYISAVLMISGMFLVSGYGQSAGSSPLFPTPPTSIDTNSVPGTIFTTVQTYLTSFNTNFTWDNVLFEMSTGYRQVTGIDAQSYLKGQYDINLWNVGADFGFSGVGSAVNSAQVQLGYDIIKHYDTKVEFDISPGYDFVKNRGVIEPGLFLKKKPTVNTFVELGISFPVYFDGTFTRTPTFWGGLGFTY